jgi:hypothetical protein
MSPKRVIYSCKSPFGVLYEPIVGLLAYFDFKFIM